MWIRYPPARISAVHTHGPMGVQPRAHYGADSPPNYPKPHPILLRDRGRTPRWILALPYDNSHSLFPCKYGMLVSSPTSYGGLGACGSSLNHEGSAIPGATSTPQSSIPPSYKGLESSHHGCKSSPSSARLSLRRAAGGWLRPKVLIAGCSLAALRGACGAVDSRASYDALWKLSPYAGER